MHVNVLTRCLILYFFVTVVVVHCEDIFDMFGDVKEKVNKKVDQAAAKVKEQVRKHVLNLKDGETCPATRATEYRAVLTAYRHVIGDWLEKFPSKNAKEYRLFLDVSESDVNRLQKFASSSNYDQKDVLPEVHTISELLKRAVYRIEEDAPSATSLTWSAWIRSFDINGIIKAIVALLAVGALSFISIRTHLRRGRWFTTFFITTFIVSVVQNWYTLYQDAHAKIDEVLSKQVPKHCRGQPKGFLDMVKAKLSGYIEIPTNECLEYYKALRATPHTQVTPVQAISMTFAQLFTTPLGAIGEGLSQFFAGTMRHVPGFLWPVIILIIMIVVFVLILTYSRYELRLPFMMGAIRPAHLPVPPPIHVIEQIDNQAAQQVQQLQNTVQQLQLELQQERTRQLEHNPRPTARDSRPASIERTNQQQRERSSSNRRPDADVLAENELRQRTTSADFGFRRDFLPE